MSGADLRRVLGRQEGRLANVADAYLRDCRARGLSPATVETYRVWLQGGRVLAWMAEAGVSEIDDFDRENTGAMLAWLREQGLSPHTVEDYRRTWSTFLRWAEEAGYISHAPRLKRGPLPEGERRALSPAEERQLADACVGDRDRALLRFMICTGLRLGETVACDLDDIEEIDGVWVVRVSETVAKGRRVRRVPLDSPAGQCSRVLAHYIENVRPFAGSNRALWKTSVRGPSGSYERMTKQGVYQIFRRLRQSTGIPCHPHQTRHTFATRCLAAGIPERSVRQAGGWRSPASITPYLHDGEAQMLRDFTKG